MRLALIVSVEQRSPDGHELTSNLAAHSFDPRNVQMFEGRGLAPQPGDYRRRARCYSVTLAITIE